MVTFSEFVNASTLSKLLATTFLFFVLMGSATLLGIQILLNETPSSILLIVTGGGITYCCTFLGIHYGLNAGVKVDMKKQEATV